MEPFMDTNGKILVLKTLKQKRDSLAGRSLQQETLQLGALVHNDGVLA
jgi:hypothetical protein